MEAATLNCPMCGAPSVSDATQCEHCGARLATVACPSCFAMIFLGSKFCQHCGAKIERVEQAEPTPKKCPRCKTDLTALALGAEHVHECPQCEGLWVDVDTFNAICADREKQAAVIQNTPPESPATAPQFSLDDVRYVPCPVCGKLMNRVNFAHGSGIILDICKADGVWFDKDELRRIVEFIRAGGLEKSREMDREIWEEEKNRAAFRGSPPPAGIDPGGAGLDIPPSNTSAATDFLGFIGRVIWTLLR
jgi:Zn-finger nucleic acid-binding protein